MHNWIIDRKIHRPRWRCTNRDGKRVDGSLVLFPFDAQFDRSGRTKSESLSGLEEVLTCLQPSTFFDDQLSRYRGLCWTDFLSSVQQQRAFNKATKSTLTSTTEEATTPGGSTPIQFPTVTTTAAVTTTPARNVLVRQSTQQDYSSRIKVLIHFLNHYSTSFDYLCISPLEFLINGSAFGFVSNCIIIFLIDYYCLFFYFGRQRHRRTGVDPREEGSIRTGANYERTLPRP